MVGNVVLQDRRGLVVVFRALIIPLRRVWHVLSLLCIATRVLGISLVLGRRNLVSIDTSIPLIFGYHNIDSLLSPCNSSQGVACYHQYGGIPNQRITPFRFVQRWLGVPYAAATSITKAVPPW